MGSTLALNVATKQRQLYRNRKHMISQRCHYALRAMLELALHEGRGPLTIRQIARAQGIPARFLEAILRQLKQAGLAKSMRGKEGGYTLARPAAKISVFAVVTALEGALFTPKTTGGNDVFMALWKRSQRAVSLVLEQASLSNLAQQFMEQKESGDHYTI